MTRFTLLFFTCLISLLAVKGAFASQFSVPSTNDALLGDVQYGVAAPGETLASVAERYDLGSNSLVAANPGTTDDTRFMVETKVKLPTAFILPAIKREGIVINLPEMRLYYYGTEGSVITYPIGIGKMGKTIPIQATSVVRKTLNPVWTPTPSERVFNAERGIDLPVHMPPGPDNPLGPFAIYLRIPAYLIHSTIFPESIGRRSSFGCIRMKQEDIETFYPLVAPGTPVTIIDMPTKAGWNEDILYIEVHPPLEERSGSAAASLNGMVREVEKQIPAQGVTLVNWQLVAYLSEQPDGIPHEIGVKLTP